MTDLKINSNLDLEITENGDLLLTESIIQAIRVRLLWIEQEWKFGPEIGFPWFSEVFVKKPDTELIRSYIRDKVLEVDGVEDCYVTLLSFNEAQRRIVFEFKADTVDGTYSEEVEFNG